ncbi:MAG: hypothetical protein U0525_02510 [Patescibacteria group bacterium]
MFKKGLIIISLLSLVLFYPPNTPHAEYNCDINPNRNPALATKECFEATGGSYKSYCECLRGGNPPNDSAACKEDPRYQLRNFAPFCNFPTIGSFVNLGTALVAVVAGLLSGFFMFYGSYQYLSAGGDAKKLEAARNRILYSIIGLIIIILAYTIVKTILDITGTNKLGF